MSSPTILYLLSALLCGAYLGLFLLVNRSAWIHRVFGAERLVEEVLETDFFDDSPEFARTPSRVSGLRATANSRSPSGLRETISRD
jgi:hypothetical protein